MELQNGTPKVNITPEKKTPQEINDSIILTLAKLREKVESAFTTSRNFGLVLANQKEYPSVLSFLSGEGEKIERTMSEPVKMAENLRNLGKELALAFNDGARENKI